MMLNIGKMDQEKFVWRIVQDSVFGESSWMAGFCFYQGILYGEWLVVLKEVFVKGWRGGKLLVIC